MKRRLEMEVAVVGGGPAGTAAALALARKGRRVVVLEARPTPSAKCGESLPPRVSRWLRQLDLETALRDSGQLRSRGVCSHWESSDRSRITGSAHRQGPGWHLDRRRFEASLEERARRAGVLWLRGTEVEHCIRRVDGSWHLKIRRDLPGVDADPSPTVVAWPGDELETRFVADATGRNAHIATRLGARRIRYDELVGIHGFFHRSGPETNGTTLVEAVPNGWWYSANLPDGRLAACFFGDRDLLPGSLLEGDSGAFLGLLEESEVTRNRLSLQGARLQGELRCRPAESSHLDEISGPNWLALGDAAAAYDPLSSQGIASALASGYYGGRAIHDLLQGHWEAGENYRRRMRRVYGAYLDFLVDQYGRQERWPNSPFWRRRRDPSFLQVA